MEQPVCTDPTCPGALKPHRHGAYICHTYSWEGIIHPKDLGAHLCPNPEDPTELREISPEAIQVGSTTVAVIDGMLCAFPTGATPESINFGPYVADLLPTGPITAHLLRFDPATGLYA